MMYRGKDRNIRRYIFFITIAEVGWPMFGYLALKAVK